LHSLLHQFSLHLTLLALDDDLSFSEPREL